MEKWNWHFQSKFVSPFSFLLLKLQELLELEQAIVHRKEIISFLKLDQNDRLSELEDPSNKPVGKHLERLLLSPLGQIATWMLDYHSNLVILLWLSYLHYGLGNYKTI